MTFVFPDVMKQVVWFFLMVSRAFPNMTEAMTAALKVTLTRRYLALWLIGSVILSVAGPFGTFDTFPFHIRLPYWFLVISISTITGHFAIRYCSTRFPSKSALRIDLAATALLSVLFTPVLYGLSQLFLAPYDDPSPGLLQLFSYVAPVGLGVYLTRRLFPEFIDFTVSEEEPVPPPRLARRLPTSATLPILRISSDDHLIDVVTADARYRLRLRLGDAVNEMDGVDGFYTHRSHWIARAAVAGVDKSNGKVLLRLSNGDTVPVSRKYQPKLEDLGVL